MVRRMPLTSMDSILRNAGCQRVSDSAKEELREILESIARDKMKKCVKIANHSGRLTILKEDVLLAKED